MGSEDLLFDACSEDEDDQGDPFEGFDDDDDEIAAAEELSRNVSSGCMCASHASLRIPIKRTLKSGERVRLIMFPPTAQCIRMPLI